VRLILTHNNADFDAVAALLAAYKLYPDAVPVLPVKLNQNVYEFLSLYRNGLPFVRWDAMPTEKIDHIILVDTQKYPDIKNLNRTTPVTIIDHHPMKEDVAEHITYEGEEVGAATTLLVESIQRAQPPITVTSLEATLLALGIYSDTGGLTYGTTTPRDIRAAGWLLEQNAVLDTVRRFVAPPMNDKQLDLFDVLLEKAETRSVHGHEVAVCVVEHDVYVDQINTVTHRLRNMLDPDAIFVLVAMPKRTQLVCRSRADAIDVSVVAGHFGGGGHARAAAANIRHHKFDELHDALWHVIYQSVKPPTLIADLMSYGVQTVEADEKIEDVIVQMRRIGHEGYPVVKHGQVIGLLTRRDADRALEHGLEGVRVKDVMISGAVTLTPDASVIDLEQAIVNSGWGQIPVVHHTGKLIGIVTRTDLIKHWAKVHPATLPEDTHISPQQIENVAGSGIARLVEFVADYAAQQNMSSYIVGGIVRDLLLQRPNYDVDFVVEGDAIKLAESLCAMAGGDVKSFVPFGTAKWRLDSETVSIPGADVDSLPDHVDFATARNEFYNHPTALPSVYGSSIKLDLHRRDFTINTLAIQISPRAAAYRLQDFYGGLNDLNTGIIRVLHSLSFIDDPTRILRAVRFSQRLGFEIEPRTAELIETSLPMLRRITGERLQNELTLLLKEDVPEKGILDLNQRGVFPHIHPAFSVNPERITQYFPRIRAPQGDWPVQCDDLVELYWHLLLMDVDVAQFDSLRERLLLGKRGDSYKSAASLIQHPGILLDSEHRPSEITHVLREHPELALLSMWLVLEAPAKDYIHDYLVEWRYVTIATDGHTLREMGIPPGPQYKNILQRLLDAKLDREISSPADEYAMLQQLVEGLS